MTTEGQGRSSDPVGFGIPVAIDGPWASPRIYPDVTGGDSGNAPGGNSLGETLGKLIQQGLNAARGRGISPMPRRTDLCRIILRHRGRTIPRASKAPGS